MSYLKASANVSRLDAFLLLSPLCPQRGGIFFIHKLPSYERGQALDIWGSDTEDDWRGHEVMCASC